MFIGKVHLVEQIPSISDPVDDEKHVPDIDDDVATFGRIEFVVAHRTFPRTVEVDADQLSPAVYHRATRVTSRGVVGGHKADRYRTVDTPTTVIFGLVQVAQSLRNVVVIDLGVVFLHNAVDGRDRLVIDPIQRMITFYGSIRNTQREVGIGIEDMIGLHLHLPFHVETVERVDLPVDGFVGAVHSGVVEGVESVGQQQCRILLQQLSFCGRIGGGQSFVPLKGREVALSKQAIYVGINAAGFDNSLPEIGRCPFCRYIFQVFGQYGFGTETVNCLRIVFENPSPALIALGL